MALLELSNIGKIYVSDNTVSVGIRGVNLQFNRGEFVAITGQSGSGKSTLLNVISGMDSYEEGEMYIEGKETSHYIQADWEEYREKYISFIFQEYNIIDSFTVLENVELSLMHIENKQERRKRAKELIKRVGLEAHMKHKGSHLSGGQKQRTVIARALAKDSPIILADEPTGNLDSQSSKEIVDLLREVSKDKLLIVVTHNFEEVEHCATREIRVYDGSVASDREIASQDNAISADFTQTNEPVPEVEKRSIQKTLKNGSILGGTIFKAMPKLSVFMCLLIAVASAALFFSFATFWSDVQVFFVDNNYMFNHISGRVVIAREDGKPISDEELLSLKDKTGAKDVLHLDYGLDASMEKTWGEELSYYDWMSTENMHFRYTYDKNYTVDVGRYPQAEDEVLLRVPSIFKERYGTDVILEPVFHINQERYSEADNGSIQYKVVGLSYYSDAHKQGEIVFTKEGYEMASAYRYLWQTYRFSAYVKSEDAQAQGLPLTVSSAVPEGALQVSNYADKDLLTEVYCLFYDYTPQGMKDYLRLDFLDKLEVKWESDNTMFHRGVYIHPRTFAKIASKELMSAYRQASLFYSSDRAAKSAAEKLKESGYVAVVSNMTYKVSNFFDIIDLIITGILYLVLWSAILVFLAFFIRICTQKSMDAFKPDIAIMRSMGIRVTEIKIAVYVRIILCVLPSVIAIPLFAKWIYSTPFGGMNLVYLRLPEYVILFVLIMIVVGRMTKKHVKNLFSENVRKALKGGKEND